ncbi:hypothetical protein BPAE_0170g00140 [Botrytis paeoniae]|uniref:Uncharacterized protein n=1 Tax=Botrytis paeoniae TaxID=278948 RepID=A0A4Z1FLI0_9HELO|nr:hypothetical protein BPAE_0170g00140 [Botrytis paeoniae]
MRTSIVNGAEPSVARRRGKQNGGPRRQTLNLNTQNRRRHNAVGLPGECRQNPFIDYPDQPRTLNNLPRPFLNDDKIFISGLEFTEGGGEILNDMMHGDWSQLERPRYDAVSKLEKVMKRVFQYSNFSCKERQWVLTALSNLYDRGVSDSLAFDKFGFKPDKQFFGELQVRVGRETRAAILLKSIGILPNLPRQRQWARRNFALKGNRMA